MKKSMLSILIAVLTLLVLAGGAYLYVDYKPADNSDDGDEGVSQNAFWYEGDTWGDGSGDYEWYVDDSGFYIYIDRAIELAKYAYICNETDYVLSGTDQDGNSYSWGQNDANIILTADIDLSGKTWIPIGTKRYFNGSFDGNGYKIKNLTSTITSSTASNFLISSWGTSNYGCGLFGYCYYATIKNVIIENAYVGGGSVFDFANNLALGTVACRAYYSTIENVGVIDGSVTEALTGWTSGSRYVGGLVGYQYYSNTYTSFYEGRMQNWHETEFTQNFSRYSYGYVGGIAGYFYGSSYWIRNSYAYFNYSSSGTYDQHFSWYGYGRVGGIVGYVYGKVQNCYTRINGGGTRFGWFGCYAGGGIAGVSASGSYIRSCFVDGGVSYTSRYDDSLNQLTNYMGGVVGRNIGYVYACAYNSARDSAVSAGYGYNNGTYSYNTTYTNESLVTTLSKSSFFTSASYLQNTNYYSLWSMPTSVAYSPDTSYTWNRIYGRNDNYPILLWQAKVAGEGSSGGVRSQIVTYAPNEGTLSSTTPNKALALGDNWVKCWCAGSIGYTWTKSTKTLSLSITPAANYEIICLPVYIPDFSKSYKISFTYTSPSTADGDLRFRVYTKRPTSGGWFNATGEQIWGYLSIPAGYTSQSYTNTSALTSSRLLANASYITDNTVWLAFNGGALTDGQGTLSYTFSNFSVTLNDSSTATHVVQVGAAYGSLQTATRTGYDFTAWNLQTNDCTNLTYTASTGNYNYKEVYTIKPGRTYVINIGQAILNSYTATTAPTSFTILFYDFGSSTDTTQKSLASKVLTFGSNRSCTMTCPETADSSHKLRMLIYSGVAGATAGNATTFYNVSIWDTYYTWNTITANTVVTETTPHTLFASWTLKTYTVSFNANSGSGTALSALTKTYGVDLTIPANEFTRSGYTANGWNTTSTIDATADYTTTYTANAAATLYANWTPNPTTMYFRFMIDSDIGGNSYTYTATPASGFEFTPYYYTTTMSGNSTTRSTTEVITQSTSVTVRQSSAVYIYTHLVKCPDGYVYAGASSSSTSYTGNLNWSGSPSTSYFNTSASSTVNGTLYCYLYFKKVSDNQLMYDADEQYFYFEDGLFPQTAVCTYDSAFELALRNQNEDDLAQYTTVNGQTIYTYEWTGQTTGFDSYIGQRFAGIKPTQDTTVKLKTDAGLTSYTFSAGLTYWFRFDPIRWRVSDYGVSTLPIRWNYNYVYGTIYNSSSPLVNTGISDVLWYDTLEGDDSITDGSNALQYDAIKNIVTLFDCDYDFAFQQSNPLHDVDTFTASTAGTNVKVTNANANFNRSAPLIASMKEIKYNMTNIKSYGSHLACVLAGVNQDIPIEYWTRDFGQTIGNGTYVTQSGEVITSSGYNQSKGIRFCTTFSEMSKGPTTASAENIVSNLWINSTSGSTSQDYLSYNKTTQEFTITSYNSSNYTLYTAKYVYLEAGKSYKMFMNVDITSGSISSCSVQSMFSIGSGLYNAIQWGTPSSSSYKTTPQTFTATYTGRYQLSFVPFISSSSTIVVTVSDLYIVEA